MNILSTAPPLRIRIPQQQPVVEQWIGMPDGTICLLITMAGLTVLACWLGHISGMPPATWWMLFT